MCFCSQNAHVMKLLFKCVNYSRSFNAMRINSMRIERFLSRTVRLCYLPEDCSAFHDLVNVAEDRLLSAGIANPDLILFPLFTLLPPAALVFERERIHFPSPVKMIRISFFESCIDP